MEFQPCLPGFECHRLRSLGKITIADIQSTVADYFHLPRSDLLGKRRLRRIARPRQVAMFLARRFTPNSLPDIGRRFGNRDHTTVMHALKQVTSLCLSDAEMRQDVDRLCRRLAG